MPAIAKRPTAGRGKPLLCWPLCGCDPPTITSASCSKLWLSHPRFCKESHTTSRQGSSLPACRVHCRDVLATPDRTPHGRSLPNLLGWARPCPPTSSPSQQGSDRRGRQPGLDRPLTSPLQYPSRRDITSSQHASFHILRAVRVT